MRNQRKKFMLKSDTIAWKKQWNPGLMSGMRK